MSNQLINPAKSFAGKAMKNHTKWSIISHLHISEGFELTTYLGMPMGIKGRNHAQFQFIVDRVWKRLAGWKDKYFLLRLKKFLLKLLPKLFLLMSCNVF